MHKARGEKALRVSGKLAESWLSPEDWVSVIHLNPRVNTSQAPRPEAGTRMCLQKRPQAQGQDQS